MERIKASVALSDKSQELAIIDPKEMNVAGQYLTFLKCAETQSFLFRYVGFLGP